MRYQSTRGTAPQLGFRDVTLAGLASDGGLYVPETWPGLTDAEIAALAGLPYAEAAYRIVRPYIGATREHAPSDAELAHLTVFAFPRPRFA